MENIKQVKLYYRSRALEAVDIIDTGRLQEGMSREPQHIQSKQEAILRLYRLCYSTKTITHVFNRHENTKRNVLKHLQIGKAMTRTGRPTILACEFTASLFRVAQAGASTAIKLCDTRHVLFSFSKGCSAFQVSQHCLT